MPTSQAQAGALADQHLMTVGKLTNNAAVCDAILFNAFKIISGCEHPIAKAIYFATESLPSKKNIMTRVVGAIGSEPEAKIIQGLITAVEKSHAQRNELSHALLRISPDGQRLTSQNPRRQIQSQKPVTAAYLGALLKNSTQAHLGAWKAFQDLCQKRGVPPIVSLE